MRCVSARGGAVGEEGGPTLVVSEGLPDTGPKDVTIIAVHHDPLPVERVLVHGAGGGRGSK